MIVTIHQPNLFPWLGFFDKMDKSDLMILLDTVPYTKGGYQNRVKIQGTCEPQWLTCPVQTKGLLGQRTSEVSIRHVNEWKEKSLNDIRTVYGQTPGFEQLFPELEAIYAQDHSNLVEFAYQGIRLIKEKLNIKMELIFASELGVEGHSSKLLLELMKAVNGSVYLSGPSGRSYLQTEIFDEAGIQVAFHEFPIFKYPQSCDFVGGLSALDYLFNDPELSYWNSRGNI